MDTDDLTPMAYDCITLAETASDVLRSELGAACGEYLNEDAWLAGILADVKEIEDDPEDYLDGWNLLEETDLAEFRKRIRQVRTHIEKTIELPVEKRGEPGYGI